LKTTTEPNEIKKILSTVVRPFSETFEQAPKIKECLQIRDGTHIPKTSKTSKTSKKRAILNNELDNFWQPQQEIKKISTGAMRLN
jgi:Uma2 family endonuclease